MNSKYRTIKRRGETKECRAATDPVCFCLNLDIENWFPFRGLPGDTAKNTVPLSEKNQEIGH